MIRVAFPLIGGKKWLGGYNYLVNLISVLVKHPSCNISPVVFCGYDASEDLLKPFISLDGVSVVRTSCFDASRQRSSLLLSLFWGFDPLIKKLFLFHNIDVIFECARFFGWRLGLPIISWLPDFQHRILPHNFSSLSWVKRELGFLVQTIFARQIMVSSFDALDHFSRFYPFTRNSAKVVRFAVFSVFKPSPQEVSSVLDFHQIDSKYFYLPNQFYRHKNHFLVLDALRILLDSGLSVKFVSTGSCSDPRGSDFFSSFLQRQISLGLSENFTILGQVPYPHIASLMLSSVAVVNPSLSEGWSTTVEESKSLGVPLILSDIAVHKEQASGYADFFDRNSPSSLAEKLASHLSKHLSSNISSAPTLSYQTSVERFAIDFSEVVHNVVPT